jgi:hypothetical protein
MCFFEPKNITFGKDIKKIEFHEDKVIKYFKDQEGYNMTLKFMEMMKEYSCYPKLLNYVEKDLIIEMENCGDLLSIKNLPNDWEDQLNQMRKSFIDKQIYILDLRFMPHTPLIINNLCLKDGKIYLVDLVMFRKRDTNFINNNFYYLINQIKLYQKMLNNKIFGYLIISFLHIYYEFYRLLYSIYERSIYNDI